MNPTMNRRLKPALIQADRDAVAALEKIAAYSPNSPDLLLTAIREVQTAMTQLQRQRVQTYVAAQSADDDATAKETEFHNLILRVKKQIVAQFGEDSNEIQSLGLKKRSDYKPPKRKIGKTAA
ncbi:hypothetical protein JNL27_17365 [bacterium]|nr:hypothetical protein [bacterium]